MIVRVCVADGVPATARYLARAIKCLVPPKTKTTRPRSLAICMLDRVTPWVHVGSTWIRCGTALANYVSGPGRDRGPWPSRRPPEDSPGGRRFSICGRAASDRNAIHERFGCNLQPH